MLRWLKNGKKGKPKSSKDKPANENYGFVNKSGKQNTNYGFREKMDDNLESSVHIYHEISEIPEISFSRQFTLLPEETNLGNNIEGPYLVVPILPARKTSASSVTDVKIESTEAVKKSSIKSEIKKRVYNEPWDKPKNKKKKNQSIPIPHPAFRDSDSSYTCSSVSTRTESSRTTDSDTGCEYDMSTSTESEVSSEYKEMINKMQNNLSLKHQILKMIKESDSDENEEVVSRKSNLKKTSSSSLDSCEFIRSRDVFDQVETESEYSSGFDECENNGSIFYQLPSKGPQKTLHDTTNHFVQQSNKPQSHTDSMKELYMPPKRTESVHSKSSSSNRAIPPLLSKPNDVNKNLKQGRYSSTNRLLGELINMNHSKQTLKF